MVLCPRPALHHLLEDGSGGSKRFHLKTASQREAGFLYEKCHGEHKGCVKPLLCGQGESCVRKQLWALQGHRAWYLLTQVRSQSVEGPVEGELGLPKLCALRGPSSCGTLTPQ